MSDTRSTNSGDEQTYRENNNGDGNDAVGTAASAAVTSVFIGLGPAAYTISEEALRQRLEEVSPVLGLRIRGHCAFADVPCAEDAERLVAELDGKLIGEARMAVQKSHRKERERPAVNRGGSHFNHGGRTSLFVGLGPSGGSISDRELRSKLEEAAPIIGFRRRGQCAFVDVTDVAHASKMIQELNNQYIGDCRLSVQYSRDSKSSFTGGRREKRGRSPGRRPGRQRSRRKDSPDHRRHRRHRSRSRSRSSRSSSIDRSSKYSNDSRDYRRRDRRRRERSRSYSTRSRSSSHSYRRRRD